MNPRIAKIKDEIEKIKVKMSKGQIRLRELEKQLVDLENADIVAAVRGIDVAPDELAVFLNKYREQQKGGTVPNLDAQAITVTAPQTNNDKEDLVNEN